MPLLLSLSSACGSADAPAGGNGSMTAAGGNSGGAEASGGSDPRAGSDGNSAAGSLTAGGAPGAGGALAGTAGALGGGDAGNDGSAGATGGPAIPAAPASCPTIATGMITVLDQEVRIWTGPGGAPGPMVFYWHGTGSNPAEAQRGLASALAEIQESGGVVASFSTTTGAGTNTGNKVWYTGDFAMADIILACAVQQGLVDARQVFTAGCSAGGLQAGAMVYGRSSYLAAAMPNSGGIIGKPALQNPAHVPALITTHGGPDDFVLISFAKVTATLDADVHAKGGFVVNCNHGLGHCESPPEVIAAQWKFLKAHPYGVAPEPYANGLPADFPAVCQIIE
jgi:hypothetical protein